MREEEMKHLTLIKSEPLEFEAPTPVDTSTPNKEYQSNPMKTDLYARLNAFRKSQKKFTIHDVIKDSLK